MRSVSGCKSESKITGCTLATIYPCFLDVVNEHQKDVSANVWGPICSPATARASDPLFGGSSKFLEFRGGRFGRFQDVPGWFEDTSWASVPLFFLGWTFELAKSQELRLENQGGIIITNTSSPNLHWKLQLCCHLQSRRLSLQRTRATCRLRI